MNEKNTQKEFDKEKWVADKQAERNNVFKLVDEITKIVNSDPAKYREYLDVQTRFDRYSPTNALLIMAQLPEATQVKDFNAWKKDGISIQKNAKAISILEPGKPQTKEDGTTQTYFNVKKVFDVSQVKGNVKQRTQPKYDDRALLKALMSKSEVEIHMVDNLPNRSGAFYDHNKKLICACRGMQFADAFNSISKEIAHSVIAKNRGESYQRNDAAFTAYSASYILSQKYGVDVSGYQFRTLPASFRSCEPQEARAMLGEIRDTVENISSRMYKELEANRKPKSKEMER